MTKELCGDCRSKGHARFRLPGEPTMDGRFFRVVETRAQTAGRRGALVGMGLERVAGRNQRLQQVFQLAPMHCAVRHHPNANRMRIIWKSVDISIDRTNRRRRESGLSQSCADGVPSILDLDVDIEHETDRVIVRTTNGVGHAGQQLFETFATTARILGTLDIDWPLGRGHVDPVAQEQRRDSVQVVNSLDTERWSADGRSH